MVDRKLVLPAFLRSIYFWITILALLWLVFLDPYSWIDQWRFGQRLRAMEEQLKFYEAEISRLQAEAAMLHSDPFAQEKYARAAFWVHRDNEVLFVLSPRKRSSLPEPSFSEEASKK